MKARIRTHYDEIQSGFKGHEDLLFAAMDFLKHGQYDEAMEVVKEDPDAYKEAMVFDFYARRMNVDRCEQICRTFNNSSICSFVKSAITISL